MTAGNTAQRYASSAAAYFAKFCYRDWDVIDYLKYAILQEGSGIPKSSRFKATFGLAIDSYIKGLERIIDDLESTDTESDERRERARELRQSYRKGNDAARAKGWRDTVSTPSIIIKNSSGFAVGDNNHVTTATEPEPRSKSKSKPRKSRKSKLKRKLGDDDDDESSSDVLPSPSWSPAAFEKKYLEMDKGSMWALPSGAFAEEVLFKNLRNAQLESLGHSFVIDVHNSVVEKFFDPCDWKEILGKVPEWPRSDESLVESMERFFKLETPADLRRVLDTTSYLPEGESYDRDKHYDRYWIHLVWAMLLPLFEDPDQLLRANHEAWYDINIWSVIVDRCLQGLEGMVVLRKETTCLANTLRKNRDRKDTAKRQKTGSRFDGLVQDKSGQFEYAAMEASKSFSSETCNKWLHDYQRVGKALHDMLSRLQWLVNHEEVILKKLQLVGLVSAGLHCQVLRMNYAEGSVCVLSRDELYRVPTTVKESSELLKLLLSIWRMKMVARDCKAIVDNRHSAKAGLFAELMEPPSLSAPRPKIPMSCDTEGEDDEISRPLGSYVYETSLK